MSTIKLPIGSKYKIMNNKRSRGRPRSLNHDRTVQSAMEHYWSDGPFELSVNEICRRTEVPKPSLYRDFGGDDGLLAAALAHYETVVIEPLASRIINSQSFSEAKDIMIEFITSPVVQSQGCLFSKIRVAPKRLGPITSECVELLVIKLRGIYSRLYEKAQECGEVSDSVTPKLAGRYLDNQVTAMLRLVAAGERPEDVREQLRLAFTGLG